MFTFAGIKDPNQNPKIKIMDSNTNGAHSAIAKKAKEDRFQGHDYYLIDELLDDELLDDELLLECDELLVGAPDELEEDEDDEL